MIQLFYQAANCPRTKGTSEHAVEEARVKLRLKRPAALDTEDFFEGCSLDDIHGVAHITVMLT